MLLKEIIAKSSVKAAGREAGLEVRMVEGQLVCRPLDPDDARYSVDFILPSMKMVEACRADDYDFFQPWIEAGRLTVAQMHHASARYHLGKSRSGKPMFWMMDERLEPQDAHIGSEGWLSTALKRREPLLSQWCPAHCLFGLHLLASQPAGPLLPVAIVEDETSALVLSELFPETLWMAYVTIGHLDMRLFAPLTGRTVTIYPRTDPSFSTYLFFHDLAEEVRQHYDIHIGVASVLEDHATAEQKERCIDLLDFLREGIQGSPR